jgi:hypothetical protein
MIDVIFAIAGMVISVCLLGTVVAFGVSLVLYAVCSAKTKIEEDSDEG